ncbi:MAG: glutamyl-tRNA reductase [SAR324 cluster bacterium]|nr:glutamyl-tRNA reductase [SAR324 cluster bacterium]
MKFAVLGWNFRKTPLEIREQLSLPATQQMEFADAVFQEAELQELVVLSTCNRTEFYCVSANPEETVPKIKQKLINHFNIPNLAEMSYEAYNIEAARHLFQVVASLDSMIIGESQIGGQAKEAYRQYLENEYVGSSFKGLFPRAFSAAKRIRTETRIAHNAVSISFAAVELAKRIFNDLSRQTIMIVGAGEMAELAAKHFMKYGVSKLLVTNRTFANAMTLAEQYQGSAIRFEQLSDYLENADIIISSTGAQNFIITEETVRQCIKRRKGNPMFFIDIAVPRDIDPRLNDLPNVYSYDIDDLQGVVDTNRKEREQEAEIAKQILEEEVEKLQSWFKNLSAVPTIRALRESFHETGAAELEKTLQKLKHLPPEQKQQIERLVHSLTNKLLHKPSHNLRQLSSREDGHLYLDSLIQLFDLSPPEIAMEESKAPPKLKLLQKTKPHS